MLMVSKAEQEKVQIQEGQLSPNTESSVPFIYPYIYNIVFSIHTYFCKKIISRITLSF